MRLTPISIISFAIHALFTQLFVSCFAIPLLLLWEKPIWPGLYIGTFIWLPCISGIIGITCILGIIEYLSPQLWNYCMPWYAFFIDHWLYLLDFLTTNQRPLCLIALPKLFLIILPIGAMIIAAARSCSTKKIITLITWIAAWLSIAYLYGSISEKSYCSLIGHEKLKIKIHIQDNIVRLIIPHKIALNKLSKRYYMMYIQPIQFRYGAYNNLIVYSNIVSQEIAVQKRIEQFI